MTPENVSPWLIHLRRTRPIVGLDEDVDTNVAIVGGGISGVATAYFLLHDTDRNVILLERDKVAHGATGHNGGQALASFERLILDLSDEFGDDLVSDGLKAIYSAWGLLLSMIDETEIDPGLQEIWSYSGISLYDDLKTMLLETQLWHRLGLHKRRLFVAEDVAASIPDEHRSIFQTVSRTQLNDMLQTKDGRYICALENRAGLMNSALFCEGLVSWMLEKYPGRFNVYERAKVSRIEVGSGSIALIQAGRYQLKAEHAILCTNGYLDFEIDGVDLSLKDVMHGTIGFMVGYLYPEENGPAATVYFDQRMADSAGYYFYMARRRYALGPCQELLSVGGPDVPLGPGKGYNPDDVPGAGELYSRIDEFCRGTIVDAPMPGEVDLSWNGLMGYTRSGVRMIGPHPGKPSLIYNMGCNGIGILPAIYGGKRIAQFLRGEQLGPSIFDPIHILRSVRKE